MSLLVWSQLSLSERSKSVLKYQCCLCCEDSDWWIWSSVLLLLERENPPTFFRFWDDMYLLYCSLRTRKIHRGLLSLGSHAGASLFLVTAMCELTRVYLCMWHPRSWLWFTNGSGPSGLAMTQYLSLPFSRYRFSDVQLLFSLSFFFPPYPSVLS